MMPSCIFPLLQSAASPGHRLSQAAVSRLLLLLVNDLREKPLSQTFEEFSLSVSSQGGSVHEESVFLISQMFHSSSTPEKFQETS